MIKVYQTKVSETNGNCAQAVIASLLEINLNDVPNFAENHHIKPMNPEIIKFLKSKGFNTQYSIPPKVIRDKGIKGYFYAIVRSQTFNNTQHAVVIDKNLNIVHDPNPNGKCLNLKPTDIIKVLLNSYTVR